MKPTYYAVLDRSLKVIAIVQAKGLDDAYQKALEAIPATATVRHLFEGELTELLLGNLDITSH